MQESGACCFAQGSPGPAFPDKTFPGRPGQEAWTPSPNPCTMQTRSRRFPYGWLGALALVLALLGGAGPAIAEAGRDAMLTRQRGEVEIRREGSTTWTPVIASRYLSPGDSGQTLAGARARMRLQFGDITLALGPSTRFQVAELNRQFGRARVNLDWGALRAAFGAPRATSPDAYQVITPNAVLAAQGTEWTTHFVTPPADGVLPLGVEALPEGWPETPPGHTRAAIHAGHVRVRALATGAEQVLPPGSTVDIGPDGVITLNPTGFPYPAEPTTGPSIERGTTGQGEIRPDSGAEVEGPTQPSPHPTVPDSQIPPSEPPHP